MIHKLTISIFLLLLLSCSRPTITQIINSEDDKLGCGSLKNSYYVTEVYKQRAQRVIEKKSFWSRENAEQAFMAASVKQQHLLNIIEQNCDTYKNPFSPDEVTEMVYNRLEREHGGVDFKNWIETIKGF